MQTIKRDEEDPDFKKVPPLSIYQFKGVNPGAQINIPEIAKNRKCTNIVCCFPMLLISLGTISFAIWVAMQVDVRRFVNGQDECGNICGVKNTKVTKDQCEPQDYTDKKIANFHGTQCIAKCGDKYGDLVFNRCVSFKSKEDMALVYHIFDTIVNKGVAMFVVVLVGIILTLGVLAGFRYVTAFTFWLFVSFMILLLVAATVFSWYMGSLFLGAVFTVVLVIVFVFTYLFVRSGKYKLVIALISEASIAIFKIPVLLVFPLVTLLLLFGLIAFTFYLVMASLANPEDRLKGNVFAKILEFVEILYTQIPTKSNPSRGKINNLSTCALSLILWILWIIGTILMFAFINGFQWMVIAGSVAQYYFTRDKIHVGNSAFANSLYITIWYHLGTISAGALIITILATIREMAELSRRNKRGNQINALLGILYACILCILPCMEEIAAYLAKKAYVITAMHGKGLLDSGKRAIRLMWYFLMDLVMVDSYSYMGIAGASIAISIVAVGVGLLMNLNNLSWYFTIFVLIALDLVGTVLYFYFSLLNVRVPLVLCPRCLASIETIFLCFCEDKLMNDGSTAHPYFMSKRLSDLMVECTDIAEIMIDECRQRRLERQRPASGDQN